MKTRYEPGRSFLHGLSPLTKLLALIAYSISIFTFDSLEIELLCFLGMLAIIALLRSRGLAGLVTSKYFISFALLLIVIQILFTGGGEVLFTIPLLLFSINVTTVGVIVGLIVSFRFVTIILASAIFIATTDPNELAYSLMKAGLPYRFGFMLVTAIRFIPVFESEAGTVRNAQVARGLDIDRGGVNGIIKMARYTLMPLVVSALSKVDVLVISMEGRAFGYMRARTFTRSTAFTVWDALISASVVALLTILVLNVWLGFFTVPQLYIYNN
jgi:energy-coupling factor transport system permease protein